MKNVINKIRTAIALMIHGEITHYDANGKLTYTKDSNGTEWWFEYYSNGTLKHSKSSIGREWVYDANGKLIHTKDVNGYKQFFQYISKCGDIFPNELYDDIGNYTFNKL